MDKQERFKSFTKCKKKTGIISTKHMTILEKKSHEIISRKEFLWNKLLKQKIYNYIIVLSDFKLRKNM